MSLDDSPSPSGDSVPAPLAPPVIPTGLNAGRAIALFLAYAVGQVAIAVVLAIPLYIYYATTSLGPAQIARRVQDPVVLLPIGILGLLGAALVVALMTRRFFKGTPTSDAYRVLGLSRTEPRTLMGAALLGLALCLFYVLVATKFFPPTEGQSFGPLTRAAMAGGFTRALWAVLAVCIAPPIEEFLFRGAMLAGFEKSMGRAPAVAIVTVAFVVLHVPEAQSYRPAIVALMGLALILGGLRIKTGSLAPSIVLHACYNLGLVAMMLNMSGHK